MGYTHYFPHRRDFTEPEWSLVTKATTMLIADAIDNGIPIAGALGEDEPEITDDEIHFNGRADASHETMSVYRTLERQRRDMPWQHGAPDLDGFVFCKTAHKPYDLVVVGTLLACHYLAPGALEISSDGTATEWANGLRWARRVLDLPLELPLKIAEDR